MLPRKEKTWSETWLVVVRFSLGCLIFALVIYAYVRVAEQEAEARSYKQGWYAAFHSEVWRAHLAKAAEAANKENHDGDV